MVFNYQKMKIAILFAVSSEASVIGLGGGINCDLDSLFTVTCSAADGFLVCFTFTFQSVINYRFRLKRVELKIWMPTARRCWVTATWS